ncbi:MAG: hydantoinase/oxoprolinase family protein [Actinobacteria bacterium]|nr:hydantoinase/oxoprolinase family protein [Actinomycetota bacterium]
MHTGADVGGTFTDVAVWDGRRLATAKVPSTGDQSEGVVQGIREASPHRGALIHGTTVATNALLERTGASTVLVADEGFEDLLEIGRQDRPSLYDAAVTRTAPLAGRGRRIGSPGRRDHRGARSAPLDPARVAAAVAALGPEAVAVSLLYSYRDGADEQALAGAIAAALPGVAVSCSSQVVAEFREFERASTTVLNAYLGPVTSRYLRSLAARAVAEGVPPGISVMRSSGGLMALEDAARLPAAVLLSGPAGGVVAATAVGEALGRRHIVSFDMGGTSTDVCRIDGGRPEVAYERAIDGLPCRMPAVAIHTVGAGGGSVGWADPGGALRVGPRSAGAVPGPASYGRGGEDPAVTDANLALGRLAGGAELGGSVRLDAAAALAALGRLGAQVGMTAAGTALGMVEVVEAHMHRAIRRVSVEEGADPRRAALVAFGGAGGLHATALARRLQMDGVIVPPHAGVFSAVGLLLAPPRADAARTVLLAGERGLAGAASAVAVDALAALGADGEVAVVADLRYRGQSHETSVPYEPGEPWEALAARFHDAHRRRNGFARPGDPIEVVTVRAEAVGTPALRWDDLPAPAPSGEARRGERPVLTKDGPLDAAVWWRPGLAPGDEVVGPAVIEEPEATTYLAAGERAVVHGSGALEVAW